MIKRAFFHELAEKELNEAASYYETQSSGLGGAFLDEVERTVGLIVQYPEAGPLVNPVVRKRQVRRFPYAVFYSIEPKEIWILAIANQHRRPFYWRGRV